MAGGCRILSSGSGPEPPRRAVERVAIVAFDNQSADAKAEQLGERVARTASLQLVGSPDVFTYVVSNSAEAPLRRATQVVSGYLTLHNGQWTLHAQLRDATAPRMLRSFTVAGSSAGALADGVAGQLGKPGFAAGKLDPAALEAALTGGPAAMLGEAAAGRLSPLPTEFPPRLAALQRLSTLAPCDSEVAYAAATVSMQARQFGKAAEAYRRAQRADPEWTLLHNEAAFGYLFAGDVPAALAAVESYRKLDPRSPNPDDSQGEILFAARRFDEAERAFLLAGSKDPAFLNGAPLRKAAEARRMTGNQAEADRLFARYTEAHAKQPLIALEKAQWDYTSGRTKEGLAALEAVAASPAGAAISRVWSQLAAWRAVQGGDAPAAAKQALQTAKSPGDQQAAATVFFATQPDASVTEWQARAAKQFTPPGSPLSRQALIYALALRKHWAEAIPILAAQRDALQPAQASEWQALLAVALREAGQPEQAKVEGRMAPIPRTAGDATWEFLIHPKIKQVAGTG